MISRFFLGFFMMLVSTTVFAGEWTWTVSGMSGTTSTAENACRMAFSKIGATLDFSRVQLNPIVYSSYWGRNVQDGRCYGRSKGNPTGPESGAETVTGHELPSCPAGQFRQWPNTTCGAVQQPPPGGATAPPPVTCTAGVISRVRTKEPAPLPSVFGGCEVEVTEVIECYRVSGDATRQLYCEYRVKNTGKVAAAGSTNSGEAPPATPPVNPERDTVPPKPGQPGGGCPVGTVQGGVGPDGVPMCVGTGTAPPNAPPAPPKAVTSTTATNADGSTTVTTTTVTTNSDGSQTTVVDKVTTAPASAGGTVTNEQTKNTSTNVAGAPGVETKPPEQTNFCKQNPTLSICRESSVTGTCGQIACMGDAIQCATLRAAAAMQCKQAEAEEALKTSPQTALGNSILAGSDPKQGDIDAALKGNTVDIGKEKLDSSGFLGAGACIAPKTFNLMGKSITMDFASSCESAKPARYVILALGFLAAYLIVSRSVLNS